MLLKKIGSGSSEVHVLRSYMFVIFSSLYVVFFSFPVHEQSKVRMPRMRITRANCKVSRRNMFCAQFSGNLSSMYPLMWRFLPVVDDQVFFTNMRTIPRKQSLIPLKSYLKTINLAANFIKSSFKSVNRIKLTNTCFTCYYRVLRNTQKTIFNS